MRTCALNSGRPDAHDAGPDDGRRHGNAARHEQGLQGAPATLLLVSILTLPVSLIRYAIIPGRVGGVANPRAPRRARERRGRADQRVDDVTT